MRAGGGCGVQQTLTSEAASVLKHSLSLARRRGHAQVTPLHVAATLLSPRSSLLKRACLKSQPPPPPHHHHHHQQPPNSHPLQCRALELCFNVALNRLPTTPAPLQLHAQPTLSNALIAALKRAQAHQRRGCIEQQQQQQQQPLLAIKVELEQLVLSILDDPSVSRVMREAGFSSTAVKNNLEDSSASSVFQCYSSSGGVYSSPCSPSPPESIHREVLINYPTSLWNSHFLAYNSDQNPLLFSPQKKLQSNSTPIDLASMKEDIKLVFEVLLKKKRRNTVIVGDSVSTTEGLAVELMDRIEKRCDDVPEEMKSAQFIKFQFSSVPLRFMKREEVDQNLSDLKRKIDSLVTTVGGGVIIYTGDLKWTVEDDITVGERGRFSSGEVSCYNPVDHLVADIGKLLSEYSNSNSKVWLMAIANYQTYMRCQMKQPSLEFQWSLQAVSVPSGGLGLSLHATSVHESKMRLPTNSSHVLEAKPFSGKEEEDKLTCCAECISKYEKEVELIKSGFHKRSMYISTSSTKDTEKNRNQLPYWLQSHTTEVEKDYLVELRRKWNRLCHSQHQNRHIESHPVGSHLHNNQSLSGKGFYSNTSSTHPWWPNQSSIFPDSNSISFCNATAKPNHCTATSLPRFRRQQSCHIEFSFSNGNYNKHQTSLEPNLDSLKNTEGKEVKITLALGNSHFSESGKLVERKSEICKHLQEKCPWQSDVIPPIVDALMEPEKGKKETSWLLVEGNDWIGKRRFAREIAESVFCSAGLLLQMNSRETGEGKVSSCIGKLERALRDGEKIVVLVEDIDFADTELLKYLADGFETGKFGESSCGKAIFILTKGSDCTSYGSADGEDLNLSVTRMKLEVSENSSTSSGTTKSDNKRKADPEWDLPNKTKTPKKEFFTSQSVSANKLDLNMKADDDDEEEEEEEDRDFSPNSSDLTRENGTDPQNPHALFLEQIKNRFVFNRDSTRDRVMREMVLSKIRESFEEVVCGSGGGGGGGEGNLGGLFFAVEEKLLDELVVVGSGGFLINSLFEKWLKDVFQASLRTVRIGGKEGMVKTRVRLCLGRKLAESSGYIGSTLPNKIQVSFIMG